QELLANIRKQVVYSIYKVGGLSSSVPQSSIDTTADKLQFAGNTSSTIKGLPAEARGSPVAKAGKTKVGRNDPCPCGSNKKYKKCCGA
ncbi:MAG: SEC-C metal-binding domain-containing protein, partial [Patescibacteria group bacterium]